MAIMMNQEDLNFYLRGEHHTYEINNHQYRHWWLDTKDNIHFVHKDKNKSNIKIPFDLIKSEMQNPFNFDFKVWWKDSNLSDDTLLFLGISEEEIQETRGRRACNNLNLL